LEPLRGPGAQKPRDAVRRFRVEGPPALPCTGDPF